MQIYWWVHINEYEKFWYITEFLNSHLPFTYYSINFWLKLNENVIGLKYLYIMINIGQEFVLWYIYLDSFSEALGYWNDKLNYVLIFDRNWMLEHE